MGLFEENETHINLKQKQLVGQIYHQYSSCFPYFFSTFQNFCVSCIDLFLPCLRIENTATIPGPIVWARQHCPDFPAELQT